MRCVILGIFYTGIKATYIQLSVHGNSSHEVLLRSTKHFLFPIFEIVVRGGIHHGVYNDKWKCLTDFLNDETVNETFIKMYFLFTRHQLIEMSAANMSLKRKETWQLAISAPCISMRGSTFKELNGLHNWNCPFPSIPDKFNILRSRYKSSGAPETKKYRVLRWISGTNAYYCSLSKTA